MKDYLDQHKEEFRRWIVDNEQGRVDIKILPYLPEKGFFVEAGALDGLFMSNTKLLEDLGWDGLLIEPSRLAVEECRKNRKVPVEECALVSKDYKQETVTGDFVYAGENGGAGAWSSINRHHYAENVEVKAKTLGKVFEEWAITKVDFLSLDVEGYELEVLKGIDFDKVCIDFMLIEINFKQYSLEDMDKYLSQFGYKNLGCLSNFSYEANPGWDGSHNDYLYGRS